MHLTAWASEKGTLAVRASLTLAVHYGQALGQGTDEALVNELRRQLRATYTSRRRARQRVCQRERRALQLCKPDRVDGR